MPLTQTTAPFSEAIAARIEQSEARVIKAVFPSNTNHHNTLFGGEALAWMDETAFIAATRFCRKTLVTVSSDRIDFKKAIPAGSLAELVARVIHVGKTSLKVEVNIFVEDMYRDHREHAIRGVFTFVAVDDERNPMQVWPLAESLSGSKD
ncbi:thioesterase superfamily [Shewanella denitrificans OS217]|jgi:acyl-CoA hydrolase|uniref:Thioesterase superfamily n=1 Tax=Shewanella denitrificans (strain OS217 / ATCC BAA-1090 / DSM 15013) TaxID=318161 RepID=Q12MD7_SHEDO|nr:acyl-CoA thioesterase [Shewanella denitrificans]ABE55389.1 thioesterase superfamily [Shewanella denitrificans OS217]